MIFSNVEIVGYDDEDKSYLVKYCINSGTIIRRSTAVYKNGFLSRDNCEELVKIIESKIEKV